ncbi:MAG: glycosyltransferase family protein [Chthonomonadales bacterium]
MRAIVAPYEYSGLEEVEGPSGERHQVLFLRAQPLHAEETRKIDALAEAYWRPEERTRIEDVLKMLPQSFDADALVYWSIEYHPVPVGIEDAPFFTAAVVGDWNLGGQAAQLCGGAFDLLIADRCGCRRLQRLNFPRVRYAPLWGFDPRLHRRLPEVHRDLDIVMAGNFNHDIQRERAPWLARVARLSHKYRVCVTTGVYGEEYVRLLCRARIVFNRSIRGEINMRAYEAAACGALLFYERDNPEIGQLFMDGEECILYGPEDLEDLLERYLTDEEARRRIAEAGWRRVQVHTNRHHLGILLDIVADEMRRSRPTPARSWVAVSVEARALARTHQWLTMGSVATAAAADADLHSVSDEAAVAPSVGRAVLLARVAEALSDAGERSRVLAEASSVLKRVLKERPNCIVARWNLAQVLLAQGNEPGARQEFEEVVARLERGAFLGRHVAPEDLALPVYPRRYDAFDVQLEDAWAAHPFMSEEWAAGVARVFHWRAMEILSDFAFNCGDFERARIWAQKAAEAQPNLAGTRFRLARALRALGRSADAREEYRNAIAVGPMYPQIWVEYAQLLADLGRVDEFQELAAQVERIAEGCPPWDGMPQRICRIVPRRRTSGVDKGGILRIVACPDWSREAAWRGFVARLVEVSRSMIERDAGGRGPRADSIEMVLRVEGQSVARTDELASQLAVYLEGVLQLRPEEPLEVILDYGPLDAEDRWLLLRGADLLVVWDAGEGQSEEDYRSLAKAMGVPIIPVDLLGASPSAEVAAA